MPCQDSPCKKNVPPSCTEEPSPPKSEIVERVETTYVGSPFVHRLLTKRHNMTRRVRDSPLTVVRASVPPSPRGGLLALPGACRRASSLCPPWKTGTAASEAQQQQPSTRRVHRVSGMKKLPWGPGRVTTSLTTLLIVALCTTKNVILRCSRGWRVRPRDRRQRSMDKNRLAFPTRDLTHQTYISSSLRRVRGLEKSDRDTQSRRQPLHQGRYACTRLQVGHASVR